MMCLLIHYLWLRVSRRALAAAADGAAGRQARERLWNEEPAAPYLVDVKVASVLRRSGRTENVTAQRAGQALQDLADLEVERVSPTTLLPRIWNLRANYTPYHACYVAVAELSQVPLLTYDARMAAAPGAQRTLEVFS